MKITVCRDEKCNKWVVFMERGFSTSSITLYDISVTELATILKTLEIEG